MKALVLDDSRAMRALIGGMLREAGFEVSQAGSADEAMGLLRAEGAADVALVDWNLPGVDGLEFVRRMRADISFARTRILMVTTEVGQDRVEAALREGVQEYLMKPFTKEMLLGKLALIGDGKI